MNSPTSMLCPHCGKQRMHFTWLPAVSTQYAPNIVTTILSGDHGGTSVQTAVAPSSSVTYNIATTNMSEYCTCTMEDQDARINAAYAERDKCVALLTHMAQELGLETGIRIDDLDASWPIVYIDLPSGQVSWHIAESELSWFLHLPQYIGAWDGHDSTQKYERVLRPQLDKRAYRASPPVEESK